MATLRGLIMPDMVGAAREGMAYGAEQKRQRTLADHMQGAIGGDKAAQSAIYSADPETGYKVQQLAGRQQEQGLEQEDRRRARLGQMARQLTKLPPEMRGAAYKQLIPELSTFGLQTVPPEYTPEVDDVVRQVAEAFDSQAAQEGYTLAPGSRRFDASGNLIAEAPFAPQKPDYQLYEGADGPAWLPKPTGAPQGGTAPGTGFGIAETDNYVQKILGNAGPIDPNAPPEQIVEQLTPHVIQQESAGNPNAVSPKGARGLMQIMPGTGQDPGFGVAPLRDNTPEENVRFGRDYLTAMVQRYPGRPDLALAAYNAGPGVADRFAGPSRGGGVSAIPIAGVAPKPKGGSVPSGYRQNPDGSLAPIPGGPAQIAIDSRADAAAAKQAAAEAKASQKRQETDARLAASADASNQLIAAIDDLTGHPGFEDLGTVTGDLKIGAPLIRSAAKDADAKLKNIAGQVALATLSQLKTLSSAGATGFGALSAPELRLVQDSIASLQSENISNAEIRRSLRVIREKMDRVANWRPPADAAPSSATASDDDDALIGKYL